MCCLCSVLAFVFAVNVGGGGVLVVLIVLLLVLSLLLLVVGGGYAKAVACVWCRCWNCCL